MSRLAMTATLAVGTILVAQLAAAHHSSAGFEAEEELEISGVIHEFQFTNPHSWIQVMVLDANGNQVEWSIEWGSPNSLFRNGYSQATFPAGEEVTMRIHPAVSGAPVGIFVGARLADGNIVGNWDE